MIKRWVCLALQLASSLFLLAFALPLGRAFPQEEKERASPRHEVIVTLKLVQVYVTGEDGRSAMDLDKSDFSVYDNGALQTITAFERHIGDTDNPSVRELSLERGPGDKKTKEPFGSTPSPRAPPLNRKFLFLFDIDHNDLAGMVESRKAAIHFLDTQTQPSDEIGVLAYSHITGLVLLEYLTRDHGKVRKAISGMKYVPGGETAGIASDGGGIVLESEPGYSSSRGLRRIQATGAFSAASENRLALQVFTGRVADLAKALSRIPGYKNIVLFSQGVPRFLFSFNPLGRSHFEEMSRELAAANCPVYAVNTASRGALGISNESLRVVSRLSGGKSFERIGAVYDFEPIAEEIQGLTQNYYVLGYVIDEKWDGKYHEIKVKVRPKGYRVQAQSGYFNPKPFSEFSRLEKQLHLIDLALGENSYFSQPLELAMDCRLFSEEGHRDVLFLAELPLVKLKNFMSRETELHLLVFDEARNIVFARKARFDLGRSTRGKVLVYAMTSLSPGRYISRLIIRDLASGNAGVGAASIEVGDELEASLDSVSPLFLLPGERCSFMNLSQPSMHERSEGRSLEEFYPFNLSENAPVVGILEKRASMILMALPLKGSSDIGSDLDLGCTLRERGTGRAVSCSCRPISIKQQKEACALLAEIQIGELAAGDFELEISIRLSQRAVRLSPILSIDVRE